MTPSMAEIGVGGAITYLSDPEEEYDEMILKALAPFSAMRGLMEQAISGGRTPDHTGRGTLTQIASSYASPSTGNKQTASVVSHK